MIFAALSEAAARDKLLLVEGGLLRYHRRKDDVVVIREVLVLPECRRKGIGKALVERVAGRYPHLVLRAKCPVAYSSNAFWRALGFGIAYTEKGVNVWERDP